MIKEWMFPWESHIMINYPFAMPVLIVILSFAMSFITWRGELPNNKKRRIRNKV